MTSLVRLLAAPALVFTLGCAFTGAGLAETGHAILKSAVAGDALSEKKQTKAGLYITAAETAEALTEREDLILLDVRSPEETMFVGYPMAADANIPFRMVDPVHGYNAEKSSYSMTANPNFVEATKAYLEGRDAAAVIVMCRSGTRSAKAVDALAEAGLNLPLYTMVDGFEGDKNDAGRREVNGWKVAGEDWTYKVRDGYLVTGN